MCIEIDRCIIIIITIIIIIIIGNLQCAFRESIKALHNAIALKKHT